MPANIGEALAGLRQCFPDAQSVLVAYSGGRDSHVLLHAAHLHADLPVRALHVAHGLQRSAALWPSHCADTCAALAIPLTVLEAQVVESGQGPEAAARDARYAIFEQNLQAHELLLQGHHADDQAETLLLRLLRGSGLRGMGAMPASRALGLGQLWRPLLALDGDSIQAYAEQHRLHWVEDPSNQESQFERNYLRQQVMPPLRQRWPSMARQFSAAARRAREAEQLLDELLQPVLNSLCAVDGSLSCSGVLSQTSSLQRQLLRSWLARHTDLPPSQAQLQAIVRDLLKARRDADPRFQLAGAELRRHRDQLYWVQPLAEQSLSAQQWCDPTQPLQMIGQSLSLDSEFGQRLLLPSGASLQIRFRQGGERIRLHGGERTLKKVLQDLAVPSWRRDSTPLLYVNDELAAVWNISIAAKFDKTLKNQ